MISRIVVPIAEPSAALVSEKNSLANKPSGVLQSPQRGFVFLNLRKETHVLQKLTILMLAYVICIKEKSRLIHGIL